MGLYAIGSECCNNCVHWDCHTERKIRGNPPKEVYTDSNCDKCDLTGRNTLSKDTCAMFRHIGGITNTFKAQEKHASSDWRMAMFDSCDESTRAFCQSMVTYARDTAAINEARRMVSASKQDDDDDLDGEAERKFARAMAEKGKANERTKELVDEGMDPKYMFQDEAIEFMHLLDRAKGGDGKAQFALAQAFWNGSHGAKKEDEESGYGKGWKWCNEAADNGYCWAELWKGVSWRNDAVKSKSAQDYEKAIKWLERALQHSEVREKDREKDGMYSQALNSSRITLGVKYLNGKDIEPDINVAMSYFEAVEDSGDPEGTEFKKKAEKLCAHIKEQFENLREMANGSEANAFAFNELGMIYAGYKKYKQFSLVVQKDWNTAVEYFSKAADLSWPDAMDNLGNCYKNGEGVERDIEKAVEWYRKSADCGWPSGQYHYATCLRKGDGVEKDEKAALKLYMKAGASGHGCSLNMLGWCAEGSHGMNEDPELAFEWYRLAAESGDAESMYELGRCYKRGYGCEADESIGDEWQKKAKENGYVVQGSW